jgi:hypothetical protein
LRTSGIKSAAGSQNIMHTPHDLLLETPATNLTPAARNQASKLAPAAEKVPVPQHHHAAELRQYPHSAIPYWPPQNENDSEYIPADIDLPRLLLYHCR